MSKLLTHLMLTASLMTGAVAYAAPDANPANMPAGSYVLEKTHASINAKVMHHGYAFYHFRFDKFDASYDFDPKNPTASKVVVTVDTKSMNTGYAKADEKFPVEFLAADKYPTATFKSTNDIINFDVIVVQQTLNLIVFIFIGGPLVRVDVSIINFRKCFLSKLSTFGDKGFLEVIHYPL